MSDWKQISTAPKDGTRILLCGSFRIEGHADIRTIGYWEREANEMISWRAEAKPRMRFYPAYWMPLPSLPARNDN